MRMQLLARAATILGVIGACIALDSANRAIAIGVLYGDPGWAFAYDGDEAFYNDPDGPNPDYVNGEDQNLPGGRSGTAALVDPGSGPPAWIHWGQQWEGSAPGDPLGGTPTGVLFPPLPPPAPGGVATYTGGDGVSFLRIQDPGFPNSFGWPDKDAQVGPGEPRQEGNNRRMLFGHDIAEDSTFSGRTAVIDNGVTISFRARLSTRATAPLDDFFFESGLTLADTAPWPDDGLGYEVSNNGRGMFMLTQTRTTGGLGQMAFSLLDDNTVNMEALSANVGTKRGLVMNNRWNAANQSVNTNDATPATANIFEIPHEDLDEWQEFWITIAQLPAPVDGNTHEINVYHNGSLTPQTFQTFLSSENEFDDSAFLGMGLSSDSRQGAFDVDFVAYKEGVHVPTLPPMGLPGDYNEDGKVDSADYVVWRKNNNTSNPLPNDGGLGTPIGSQHYNLWVDNFGSMAGSGSGSALGAVPEPSSFLLFALGAIIADVARRRF